MTSRSCKSCGVALTSENTTAHTGLRCLGCFREHRAALSRAYYQANRAKSLARCKARAESLPAALRMWERARQRAARKKVPFTITPDDIHIPLTCPVLGIPLAGAPGVPANRDNRPSLDRLVPNRGYVPGNIAVISFRANAIKQDATPAEVQMVHKWMSSMAL